MKHQAPRAAGASRSRFARKLPFGIVSLVALLAGLIVTLAPGANAANPLPAPITDYANYPATIVPSLIPDGCSAQGPAIVTGTQYSSGSETKPSLSGLNLEAGDHVTMTWTGWAQGCDGARISLALKSTKQPVFVLNDDQTLVSFDSCGGDGPSCTNPDGGFGPLTITVPPLSVTCNFQVDSVIGPPLQVVGPDGSYYSQDSRKANGKPSGPNMLISAHNGGAGDCVQPPQATAHLECALIDGAPGVQVTVTNPDDTDTSTVDILKNSVVVVDNLSIAPSGTESRNIAFSNGETATVSVEDTVGNTQVFSQSFTANCLNPTATAAESCSSGGVLVHLADADALDSVSFVVTVDGTSTTHIVAMGGSQDFVIPDAQSQTVHVTITVGDTTLIDQDFTANCVNPAATATKSCASGGVDVDLSDTGAELPETFTVTVGNSSTEHDVAAGGSEDFTIPVADHATVHVTITVGQFTLVDQDFTLNCLNPAATATPSCTSGGVQVHLSNTDADETASFVVTVNGATSTHDVAGGGSEDFVVPVAEDSTVHVTITSGGTTFVDEDFTANCVNPAATASKNCVAGGVQVHLSNTDAELPATFIVTVGDTSTTHDVAAGATEDFTIPVSFGDTVHVTITASGGGTAVLSAAEGQQPDATTDAPALVDSDFTMDCFNPQATIVNVCAAGGGGATITFTNTGGEVPVALTVTKNGSTIDTVTVPADGTVTRTYALDEDETATFRVTGAGFDSGDQSLTHDCNQVQAVTVTTTTPQTPDTVSGQTLPRTGAGSTKPLAWFGGIMLLVGGFFLVLGGEAKRRLAAVRSAHERGR